MVLPFSGIMPLNIANTSIDRSDKAMVIRYRNYMADSRPGLPDNWKQMTPEQKRQYRLDMFQSTEGIDFVSPEAKKAYEVRAKRRVDVMNVQEPDRVPVNLPVGNLPLILYGINTYTAMYDYDKAVQACKKFNEQYSDELEYFASPYVMPGRVLDILDYKLYAWPGHGIPQDMSGVQYIEGEYMKEDEYDALILDPSDFWLRTYLPRVFGIFEPFRMFQPFTNITEDVHIGQFRPLSMPQVQDSLQKMLEIGKEYQKMSKALAEYSRLSVANGFPAMMGNFCKAPFDTIGDTLRGTHGIMKDMFQQPDKLLEALDVVADLSISTILNSPNIDRATMVMYPLHKGADGWMSEKHFNTFYWPSFKKVMNAFIEEGLIQSLFAEGSYNTRLETVNEFPKGTVSWYFDQTDMFRAKRILGDKCCIQGNVPSSLIFAGSPEEVKEYCRKLIEVCGKGGGYILSAGAGAEKPKMENLRAMLQAVKEYGVYKK
jgi:uroporphyrinogen-III decarboxylase